MKKQVKKITPPDDEIEEENEEVVEQRSITCTYDVKTKLAVASTATVDRQGESIDQSGWDLKNYLNNPIILWAHNHTIPAIGTAPDMRVSKAGGEKRLVFTPQFHDATPEAAALKFLYEGDNNTAPVLNSFSVGFIPKDFDPSSNTYTKQELLEVSAVNVPANADARMMAYKALKTKGFEEDVIESLGIPTKVLDTITQLRKDVSDLQSLVKGNIPPAPKLKVLTKRQMLAKAISKAADILLEGDKHETLSMSDKKTLAKIIKRASEKISASQKVDIHNG